MSGVTPVTCCGAEVEATGEKLHVEVSGPPQYRHEERPIFRCQRGHTFRYSPGSGGWERLEAGSNGAAVGHWERWPRL